MTECPRGRGFGECCAIQKNGAVFVQELNQCRDAVRAARVPITKHAIEEEARMNAPHDRVNLRTEGEERIQKGAERMRHEHPELTESQARVKAMEADPEAHEMHVAGCRRGDPPHVAEPEAIAKRALTQAEYVYAKVEERGREYAIRKGVTPEQGRVAAMEADPELYDAYRAAERADERERRTAR